MNNISKKINFIFETYYFLMKFEKVLNIIVDNQEYLITLDCHNYKNYQIVFNITSNKNDTSKGKLIIVKDTNQIVLTKDEVSSLELFYTMSGQEVFNKIFLEAKSLWNTIIIEMQEKLNNFDCIDEE